MTRTLSRLGLAALTFSACLVASRPAPAADPGDGFHDLFNGKDMAGFKYVIVGGTKEVKVKKGDKEIIKKEAILEQGDDPLKASKKTWRVEDGAIVCTGNPNGYFYTAKSYKDYVLRYDWRYKKPASLKDDEKFGGNSGFLANIEGNPKIWPKCIEVQGRNLDHGKLFYLGGTKGKGTFDAEALKQARKPVGEWNATEITFHNGKITAKVNGAVVATGTGEWVAGPHGWQSEGAEIHFKNIKIKELK